MLKRSLTLTIALIMVVAIWTTAAPGLAQETTIIVDSTSDNEDFGGAQKVQNLPGPDGRVTLREAITAANNTDGPQTIAFNIPTSDPGFNGEVFIIFVENFPQLTLTDDDTTIDGTTQTAFSGDTNPSGPEIHVRTVATFSNFNGLTLNSNDNTITGLTGLSLFRYGIEINGDNNLIRGNVVNQALSAAIHITGSNNVIGGTEAQDANRLINNGGNGVWIRGTTATANRVVGNTISGNHTYGLHVEPDTSGNVIGGATVEERNIIAENGHLSSEGHPVGANAFIEGSNNVLQGNYIGVDAGGQAAGNLPDGVEVTGSFNQIVDNVISGHNYQARSLSRRPAGILIRGGAETHDLLIQGNLIGTDPGGANAVPNQFGIRVMNFLSDTPHDILIGGSGEGEANVIAFNSREGVTIADRSTGIRLSRNSIHSNGLLGIDLDHDGVTANDPGDTDTGANNLQNFPVIESANDDGESTVVSGSIDTQNPETVTLEFFSNDEADPSGFGEGQTFEDTTTPDADGRFTVTLRGGLAGKFITATATDANGNTSEFSEAVLVTGDASPTPTATASATPEVTPTPEPSPTATPQSSPTATPQPSPTATPQPSPTPTQEPAVAMHVGDLDGEGIPDRGNKWDVTVTITVHDANHAPVAGATVRGRWSGGASGVDTCTTNDAGTCSVTKQNINGNQSDATLTVEDVSHGTLSYEQSSNHDPDGDSNGTSITVLQP